MIGTITTAATSVFIQFVGHHIADKASAECIGRKYISLGVFKFGERIVQSFQVGTGPDNSLRMEFLTAPSLQRNAFLRLDHRYGMFRIPGIGISPLYLRGFDCRPFFFGRNNRIGQFFIRLDGERGLSGRCSTLCHSLLGKKRACTNQARKQKCRDSLHGFIF